MPMIQVSRDLILRCAEVLSPSPRWRRRPLRACVELIYGLNSLSANHPHFRYNFDFPRPSVVGRELKRIQSLCKKASQTGDSHGLFGRINELKNRNSDSYGLLLSQSAIALRPEHPSSAIHDEKTYAHLEDLAWTNPLALSSLAACALANLRHLMKEGRGGARHVGNLVDRAFLFELGVIFEAVTGRPPGVTYDPINGEYTGAFVRFAQIVFEELKEPITGRQIYRLYRALDVPEWRERRQRATARQADRIVVQSAQ